MGKKLSKPLWSPAPPLEGPRGSAAGETSHSEPKGPTGSNKTEMEAIPGSAHRTPNARAAAVIAAFLAQPTGPIKYERTGTPPEAREASRLGRPVVQDVSPHVASCEGHRDPRSTTAPITVRVYTPAYGANQNRGARLHLLSRRRLCVLRARRL